MRFWYYSLVLVLGLAVLAGCHEKPGSESNGGDVADLVSEDGWVPDFKTQEITGNERWVQPAGTAKITFWVDDRENQTFQDGDITWTGSFAWNEEDNTIVWSAAWGPNDGPYPLLYDDGPVSQGGHEMAGAEAGDHIFSTEVYFAPDAAEDTQFDYGVLNELGFWMWEGPNGQFTVPAGSTAPVDTKGLTLAAFGNVDLKITMDMNEIHSEFAQYEAMEGVQVFVKGAMNMWAPTQILDMGAEVPKGDEVAGDGIYTYVHGLNLGEHTGLLQKGQHAQFTLMFAPPETSWEDATEYKILTEGRQKGVLEGVRAYVNCTGDDNWQEVEIVWETDSWGSTDNTTVVADCEGEPPPPDCTPEADDCPDGEKCIDNECKPWCDTDEECADGEKCMDNACISWCDLDEDCPEGQQCIDNACQEQTVVSEPKIVSVAPDSGPTDGGTLVTITGSDFQDGAAVTFEGTPATGITVLSDTAIECASPALAAGKADVTVTNPDGGKDTYLNAFNYVEEALAPVITGVDPVQGPTTGGTQVAIAGENFLPNPTVLFGSTIAASVEFVNSGLVKAVTPAGALGAVDVVVTNSDTQSATLTEGFTYVPNVPDYVKLLPPTGVNSFAGQATETLWAEVWEPAVTPGPGAGSVVVEAGYGPAGSDPAAAPESWQWQDAVYDSESGNNDVWTATLTEEIAGEYAWTFRFSMDSATWVYADTTGNLDGFQTDSIGTWSVTEVGTGPVITDVSPKAGSVLGGTVVTLTGLNLEGASLTVDGAAVTPDSTSADSLTFTTPEHAAGAVDLAVAQGDDVFTRPDGFSYVLRFTPAVDGSIEEWEDLFIAAENTVESNWDAGLNMLDTLYVAFDDQNLYVTVTGEAEASNYILGYVDVDYGQNTGPADMVALGDNSGNGDLDDALSNVLLVTGTGFGAEFAFGARGEAEGMSSYFAGDPLSESKFAGWRALSPADNFPWLDGTVAGAVNGFEAVIPLATLLPDGVPPAGRTLALFVKLSNGYGGFSGISNQTLPEYWNEDSVHEVGTVFVFTVSP